MAFVDASSRALSPSGSIVADAGSLRAATTRGGTRQSIKPTHSPRSSATTTPLAQPLLAPVMTTSRSGERLESVVFGAGNARADSYCAPSYPTKRSIATNSVKAPPYSPAVAARSRTVTQQTTPVRTLSPVVGVEKRDAGTLSTIAALLGDQERRIASYMDKCMKGQREQLVGQQLPEPALQKMVQQAVDQAMSQKPQDKQLYKQPQEQASAQMPSAAEDKIIAHISACFQEHSQVLQQVRSAQEQQQATLEKVVSAQGQQESALANQQRVLQQVCRGQRLEAANQEALVETLEEVAVSPMMPGMARSRLSVSLPKSQVVESSPRDSVDGSIGVGSTGKDMEGTQTNLANKEIPDDMKNLCRLGSTARMATLFPDVEDLKGTVVEALEKQLYDVEHFYKDHGWAQALARNEEFKHFVLLVILANTIWIAVETDYNHADILCQADLVFQIVDNVFCTIFTIEIFVRFMAFAQKYRAFRDSWFVFDSILVSLMIWETWIEVFLFYAFGNARGGSKDSEVMRGSQVMRWFRLVRLVRVARATRIVSAFPELLLLMRGMIIGLKSVFAVLCMQMLVVYIFGVVFTMTLRKQAVGREVFATVPSAMNTLLLQVLCGADADFINSLLAVHWVYFVLYLGFLLIANLTLMNMLIGILCDVVSNVASDSKEELFIKEVEAQIARVAREIDQDGSETIDKEEFQVIISDPIMTTTLNDLGVDIVGVANFAKFIYEQCDEISYIDFGILVGQFRGSKMASVQDVMDMRRYVTMELLSFEARIRAAAEGPSKASPFASPRDDFARNESSKSKDLN